MRRDVFQAIADPRRRAIIHILAQHKLTVSQVAGNFQVSLPAIAKHLKILQECGLVEIKQQGRERYCEVRLEKLATVSAWVNEYQRFWESKLVDLKNVLESKKDKSK